MYLEARFVPGYDIASERRVTALDPAAAEALLREALRLDPDFVAARIQLARALEEQRTRILPRQPADEREASKQPILVELDRAVASAERSSEVDRQMASAAFAGWHAEHPGESSPAQLRAYRQQQAAACNALFQLKPDDVWALSCVIEVTLRLEEPVDVALLRRLTELRPNGLESHFTATRAALLSGDADAAAHFARLGAALDVRLTEGNANTVAKLRMFNASAAWLGNRPADAVAAIDRALASVAGESRIVQLEFWWYAAYANLTLGRLGEAERLFRMLDAQPARRGQIWVDVVQGDPARLRQTLKRGRIDARGMIPISSPSEWIEAGEVVRAHQALASVQTEATQYDRVRGELAVISSRPDLAIQILEDVLPREPISESRMRIARFLARAWVDQGDNEHAIHVLESASTPRRRLLGAAMIGVEWLSVRDQLAQLYRAAGRTADAAASRSRTGCAPRVR